MSRPLRVIQWGTGNVGKHALRGVLERSDLELVGVRVYNGEKVGVDAGGLVGRPTNGVTCTNDVDQLLATPADCVIYTPLAETLPGGDETALDEICALLASGKNVSSTAVSHHVYPKVLSDKAQRRLADACDVGCSTFFSTGVNPGFAFDIWPITMTHLSRRIDRLVCSEFCDMAEYTSSRNMYFMGFGQLPDFEAPIVEAHRDEHRSAYYSSMLMLADALRVELSDMRFARETAVATSPIETRAGVVESGTVAATRLRFTGYVDGDPRLEFRVIWRVTDRVAADWGVGDGVWTIEIDGDPAISTRLDVATTTDSGRAVSITTAMHPLNAVPAVCAAPSGVLSHLDLPLWSGGYVPHRASAR